MRLRAVLAAAMSFLLLVCVIGIGNATAQNPVRGVIRPVPGSRPLAIRTPTVGLAPVSHRGGSAVVAHRGGHVRHRPVRHYGNRYYGRRHYGYGHYRPYGVVGWGYYPVGVSINFGTRFRSVGVSYGYPGTCFGGFGYRTVYTSYTNYWPGYNYSPYYISPLGSLDSPLLDRPRRVVDPGAPAPGAPRADEAPIPPPADPADMVRADGAGRAPAAVDVHRERRPTVSSVSAIRRALRSVSTGDDLFKRGEYLRAQSNYRNAIRYAPDLAETHLHYGFSLVATKKYKQAAEEFKKAIDFDPELVVSETRMTDFYEDPEVMHEHLEGLAEYALDNRRQTDVLFAVGVCLHYIGETDRAVPFFERTLADDRQWDFAATAFVDSADAAPVEPFGVRDAIDAPVLRLGAR